MSEKKIVIYIRVSTSKQAKNGYGLDAQLERCQAYCTMKGIALEDVIILKDGGFSGGSLERPNFKKMMSGVERGLYDTIIIFKLDRISRSIADFSKILKFLSDHGVQLVSVNEGLDLSSLTGQLIAKILVIFAEFELGQMSLRTSEALRNKALSGYYPYGGAAPLGYIRKPFDKKMTKDERLQRGLELDPQGVEMYHFIVDKFLETHSIKSTHSLYTFKYGLTHPLTKESIHDILKNKIYLGYITLSSGEEVKLCHEPLIEEDKYNRVQQILERKVHTSTFDYLFKDMLICECGARLKCTAGTSRTKQRYLYYRCPNCNYYVSENKLADKLDKTIEESIHAYIEPQEEALTELQSQIEYLNNFSKEMATKYVNDEITFDDLQKANKKIKQERNRVKRKIAASQRVKSITIKKTDNNLYLNSILHSQIDYIEINKNNDELKIKKIVYIDE